MAIIAQEVDGLVGLVSSTLAIARALPADSFLWYRGLPRTDYTLIPKIMRDGRNAEQVFERERRLLTRFRQRSVAYWAAGYAQTDWDHLFAMQHAGMPTRLLDWTENLFVAAYFAISPTEDPAAEPPCVWCVDPIAWNRAMPVLSEFGASIHVLTTSDDEVDSYRPESSKRRNRSPVALFGTHNSQRIVAQRGTFMIWGNDPRPLEEFANETNATLWKLAIRGSPDELLRNLTSLGFGETMVFPELTALAAELSKTEGWRH